MLTLLALKLILFFGHTIMATSPSLNIDNLALELNGAEIAQHPVEVHGALVGLICGGAPVQSGAWVKPLLELVNDGQPLPPTLMQLINDMYQDAATRLAEFEFGFTPLQPEEEEPLSVRVEALSLWTQSFLTGLAIIQPKLNKAPKDVCEVIKDLAEIAQVEFDVAEDEESEAAYAELLEFVRMAAIMCHAEFVAEMSSDNDEPEQPLH